MVKLTGSESLAELDELEAGDGLTLRDRREIMKAKTRIMVTNVSVSDQGLGLNPSDAGYRK